MFFSKYSVILFSYLFLNNAFISTQARPGDIEPRDYYDENEVDDDRAFKEEEVKGLEKELAEEENNPDEVIEFEEEVVKDDDNGDDDDDVKVEVPLVEEELEGEPEEKDDVEDEVKPYAGNPEGDVDDSNGDDELNIPDELDDDKDDEVSKEEDEEDTKEEDDDDDNDDDGSNGGDEDAKGNTWRDKVKQYYKNFRYYIGYK